MCERIDKYDKKTRRTNLPQNWPSEIDYISRPCVPGESPEHGESIRGVRIGMVEALNHPCKGQRGLFAQRRWKTGELLGIYAGDVLPKDFSNNSDYIAVISLDADDKDHDQVYVDAKIRGNELRFVNDGRGIGKPYNLKLIQVERPPGLMPWPVMMLTKDVEVGEEFLVCYGKDYWEEDPEEHGERCRSCNGDVGFEMDELEEEFLDEMDELYIDEGEKRSKSPRGKQRQKGERNIAYSATHQQRVPFGQ